MPIKNKTGSSGAWIPIAMTLMLVIGFLTGMKTSSRNGQDLLSVSKNKSTAFYKVDEVLGFISQRYVDSVDVDQLAETAIKLIVDSLDPHSHYLSVDVVEDYNSRMEGHYVGVGIEYRLLRDTLVITDVLTDSPASKAGLKRGDQIIMLDQDTISGTLMPTETILDLMKGERKSKANIKYLRCDTALQETEIVRNRVNTKSVPLATAIDDETVYVAVEQFNANVSKEFLDALEPFHEAGKLKNLVIDLRQNPGGYLQEAVRILNQFFDEKGKLLVYTEGMRSKKKEYKTQGKTYLDVDQLFILIDENSASASEIIAGAIQDLDRGTIIGRRSFGKGLVQEQYELSHGGNLKLTIAKYYTPSGRLIQKELGDRSDYDEEFYDRATSGEWSDMLRIPLPDTTSFYSPSGKRLFGSRGIVPDVFIPIDTQLLADNSYEMFVLKEEIAFDLFRHATCQNIPLDDIKESLREPFWKEWLKNKTTFENFGRLQSIDEPYAPVFISNLIENLRRYENGKVGRYTEMIQHDPYIAKVRELLEAPAKVNQLSKIE